MTLEGEQQEELQPDREPETLYGISGSPGIVVGRVVVLRSRPDDLVCYYLENNAVPAETERFLRAVDKAEQELADLRRQFEGDLSDTLSIIDSHLRMLRDRMIIDQTLSLIRQHRINAEWAVSRTLHLIKRKFDHLVKVVVLNGLN